MFLKIGFWADSLEEFRWVSNFVKRVSRLTVCSFFKIGFWLNFLRGYDIMRFNMIMVMAIVERMEII